MTYMFFLRCMMYGMFWSHIINIPPLYKGCAVIFFLFFVFCVFGFHVFSMLFWCVHFILLHFLVRFQRFLRFCGLFLSIRYAFCYIPCSCFADVTCFFNLTLASLHFEFAIMFYSFEILRSFLSFGYILLSFWQVLGRFNVCI